MTTIKINIALMAFLLFGASGMLNVQGQNSRTKQTSSQRFDPSDPADVRLWNRQAQGAVGDDPCRDIPFIRVYRADTKSLAPALLIIPGGGYDRLTDAKEQAPVAEFFAQKLHVTAFVLYYRLVQKDGTYRYPVPMWDGQRALRLIRAHADDFGVDPDHIGLFGFSAGGHLASTLALHSASDFNLPRHDSIDHVSAHPTLLGLGYPVISMDPTDVPLSGSSRNLLKGYHGSKLAHLRDYLSGEKHIAAHTPPVFLFESMDDAQISPQNSVLFVKALHDAGVPVDAHLFAHGIHGAGLAQDIPEEKAWPEMFHQWLISQKFVDR